MTAGTGYYGINYLLNSNSDESSFLRYNYDLNHTLYNIYRTNETELTLNEANYFPFTYMYVKDVTDNFATVPAQINDWLYGVDGFFNRIVEDYVQSKSEDLFNGIFS